jgi:hypothetical protein
MVFGVCFRAAGTGAADTMIEFRRRAVKIEDETLVADPAYGSAAADIAGGRVCGVSVR